MDNRDATATWRYHDGTKHSLESLQREPHYLEWDIMPRPFKIYTGLESLPLPRDFEISAVPALEALEHLGEGAASTLDLRTLARLLHFSAGVMKRRRFPGGAETFFRAAACTGNLHHIDLYLVCADLPDLEAGVYHFGPHDFGLRRLRRGDHRGVLAEATGGDSAITGAPAIAVCTTTFWRNAWKYRSRAYRHCFWDSGTLLANLLATAAAAGVRARVELGFADDPINRLLALDTEREVALELVPLGDGAVPPPAAPPLEPIETETLPLSERQVDYPAIRAMHAASCLETREEVRAWRRPPVPQTPAEATGGIPLATPPLRDLPRDPLERVIERRGSARSFRPQSIAFAELSVILDRAGRHLPTDFAGALNDVYVIVHAVDGLEAGTYHFDSRRGALQLLEPGDFRRDSRFLDLGQDLAAEAAVNLYWLGDLDPILDRYGNRGYRAAQLDAAIRGGVTYLAAYALGLGATGLTFFDDQVTHFFSPHAAAKSVMFLMAVGHPGPAAGAAAP